MPELLLRTSEVAHLFRVDIATVRAWIRAGRLRSVRAPSGQYRVRNEDVEALLREQTNTATEAVA